MFLFNDEEFEEITMFLFNDEEFEEKGLINLLEFFE